MQKDLKQVYLTRPKVTSGKNFFTAMEKEYERQLKELVVVAEELKTYIQFVKFLEKNKLVFQSKLIKDIDNEYNYEVLDTNYVNLTDDNKEKLSLASTHTLIEWGNNDFKEFFTIQLTFYKPLDYQLYKFFNLL